MTDKTIFPEELNYPICRGSTDITPIPPTSYEIMKAAIKVLSKEDLTKLYFDMYVELAEREDK